MTTPKQYSGLDNIVYDTDSVKLKEPVRSGKFVYENYPKNIGQKYEILNTIDTNDKYNSQGYEKNGFQAMIVAPMTDGKVDYSHLIIAYAGTNATDWHLNDLSADISNVVLGFQKDGTLDSQFTSAQQFYDENDFGKWSVGAKLKLSNSSWYDVDVSKDGVEVMGQGFPDKNMQGGTESSVKVVYSNGESELIK